MICANPVNGEQLKRRIGNRSDRIGNSLSASRLQKPKESLPRAFQFWIGEQRTNAAIS
jgi:hypothetical protein